MTFLELLGSTILLRPYVFIFLALYLWSAVQTMGVFRAFVFTLLAYAVAFSCEYSSTRIGFPFGDYYYIDTTRDRELWISNVPFMDSLSFTFLSYASYALARLFIYSARDIVAQEDRWKRGFRVALLTGLFMMMIDMVIDPVALRGDRWFLGQIYGYPEPGIYFGVPIANFLGWAFVGMTIVFLFRWIDRVLLRGVAVPTHSAARPCGRWGGVALYGIVLFFNLVMTVAIGETLLAILGVGLFIPVGFALRRRASVLAREGVAVP